MKIDRAATFGSHEKLLASRIKHRQKRLRLEDLRAKWIDVSGRLAESNRLTLTVTIVKIIQRTNQLLLFHLVKLQEVIIVWPALEH